MLCIFQTCLPFREKNTVTPVHVTHYEMYRPIAIFTEQHIYTLDIYRVPSYQQLFIEIIIQQQIFLKNLAHQDYLYTTFIYQWKFTKRNKQKLVFSGVLLFRYYCMRNIAGGVDLQREFQKTSSAPLEGRYSGKESI